MKKSKKKFIISLVTIALSCIMILSASYAWFTSTDERKNHFATEQITDGSVSLFELFTPPTDWKPGQSVTKQVAVANNGDSDVLVRISFEEVLYKLGNGGVEKTTTSATSANGDIPVNMGITSLTAANGWSEIGGLALTSTTIPQDVKVLGKKLTVNKKTEYYFVMYYPTSYTDDLGVVKNVNQKVTADFKVDANILTLSNVNYYYFTKRDEIQKDWAGQNVRVGKPPYTPKDIPATPQSAAKVDEFLSDNKILIDYSADVYTAIKDNTWYYNEQDGYFYLIDRLLAGTISPNLTNSITLAQDAGDEYALLDLDLIVLMDAIQNTTDALISKTGWALEPGTLLDALTKYCAY